MTALLLLTRDGMYSMMVLDFYTCQYLTLGILGAMGIAFLQNNRNCLKMLVRDIRASALLAVTAVMLLPMFWKQDWRWMYFSILLGVWFGVFLTFFAGLEEVARWYVLTVTALAVWSLFASYGLRQLVERGFGSVSLVPNSHGVLFHNFLFTVVPQTYVRYRNFGCFREPGVYQFFLLLGLYLNNYALKWEHMLKLWTVNVLLALTVLSTFAVGGYIELALFSVFLFFDKGWHRSKQGRRAALWIVTLAAAGAVCVVLAIRSPHIHGAIFHEFYDIFHRLTTRSASLTDRLDAIFLNLRLFLESPLFGDTLVRVLHGTENNTSSTLILYAVLGIFGGSLNVAAWVALLWRKERNLFANLVLLGIFFLSFNTQNLVTNLFFWLFPMMSLTDRGMAAIESRKRM